MLLRSLLLLLLPSAAFWWLPGLPDRPWIAVELLWLGAVLASLPARFARTLVWPLAALSTLLLICALADAGVRAALSRPFNLVMDWRLLAPAHGLLTRNLGAWALAIEFGIALALIGAVVALALLLRSSASLPPQRKRIAAAGSLALLLIAALGFPRTAPLAAAAVTQTQRAVATRHELRTFARTLDIDPLADIADADLFSDLAGVDVIVAFVESYGADVLDDPRYAPLIRSELGDWAARFAEAGLSSASARFVSPVQGGQSWLAQTTLLSGQWIDSPLRYSLITSRGAPGMLPRDFARAGHASIAVRPANTLAWPEAPAFGYQRIVDAAASGYRGPALNWITMPDQYTWDHLQRTQRGNAQAPHYIDVALISSHAPWTPVLPVITDWDHIGDGSLFAEWADADETPEQLWRDSDRVREHYARALRYSLAVIGAYAQRYVDERTLLIVLGDHPAAPLITGGPRHAVPMHVISGDAALVQRFVDAGFGAGNLPPERGQAPQLSDFRSWLADSFSRSRERRRLLPPEQPDHVAAERDRQ